MFVGWYSSFKTIIPKICSMICQINIQSMVKCSEINCTHCELMMVYQPRINSIKAFGYDFYSHLNVNKLLYFNVRESPQ